MKIITGKTGTPHVTSQEFRQFAMNCPAAGASEPAHGPSCRRPAFRPYNPWHTVIIFQHPAALGTGGLVLHHHKLPSNLN